MKKLYAGFILFISLTFNLHAQKIQSNAIDGELYVKVKSTSAVSVKTSTSAVDILEVSFISEVSKQVSLLSIVRPFYFLQKSEKNIQNVYRVKIANPAQIKEIINLLSSDPNIEHVERVPYNTFNVVPNAPSLSTQWHLNTIKAYDAWNLATGNAIIKVAVVDNAMQTTHTNLARYDVADGDTNPNPPDIGMNHGTHVSGIIGAVTNNGVWIGYNKIQIIPVKSNCDACGNSANFSRLGRCSMGDTKINMSWEGGTFSQTAQDLFSQAYSANIVSVAAAGNSSTSTIQYSMPIKADDLIL